MASKTRLDQALVTQGLVSTRSQAENYIKLGYVLVNDLVIVKSGFLVEASDTLSVASNERYVSRAALKLASVASVLNLDFKDQVVLDVGSSTGGFTDYALQHGAKRVVAVEVGTNQLHQTLRGDPRIDLYEQTDIRDVHKPDTPFDIVVIDVSFVSLRDILPHLKTLVTRTTNVVAMVKPQFEAPRSQFKHKGVIKNDTMRRTILRDFEQWTQRDWIIKNKADSMVKGAKGNAERFYLLRKV